ncbi:MAG: hypothetical protein OHK0039_47790 [Bacteroidia bacterium]
MHIAVIGPEDRIEAWRRRFPSVEVAYSAATPPSLSGEVHFDLIFDLDLDDQPERLSAYVYARDLVLFASVAKTNLATLAAYAGEPSCALIGLNALPGMIERQVLECSLLREQDRPLLEHIATALDFSYELVEDRTGMVTPRILAMIINEAFTMMQEGSATPDNIDLAMRLGTNYPQGPIAWAWEIGLHHLVELLDTLRAETGDNRYRVAPLLRRTMLRAGREATTLEFS